MKHTYERLEAASARGRMLYGTQRDFDLLIPRPLRPSGIVATYVPELAIFNALLVPGVHKKVSILYDNRSGDSLRQSGIRLVPAPMRVKFPRQLFAQEGFVYVLSPENFGVHRYNPVLFISKEPDAILAKIRVTFQDFPRDVPISLAIPRCYTLDELVGDKVEGILHDLGNEMPHTQHQTHHNQ